MNGCLPLEDSDEGIVRAGPDGRVEECASRYPDRSSSTPKFGALPVISMHDGPLGYCRRFSGRSRHRAHTPKPAVGSFAPLYDFLAQSGLTRRGDPSLSAVTRLIVSVRQPVYVAINMGQLT